MFTIGIFSTHIPYIAFILFYAYFFVAGVNKAVSGEIPNGENVIKTEIYTSNSFTDFDVDTYHFFCKVSDSDRIAQHEDFLFKRKINYPVHSLRKIKAKFYYSSFFNKPPPFLVV